MKREVPPNQALVRALDVLKNVGEEERILEGGERIDRVQTLQPGYYWRARRALKDGDRIPKGCVLLLQRIKRVDDKPHAVELAGHPKLHPESTFTFLVHDFLNDFEPEPNGPAIRAKEMAEVQKGIEAAQVALIEATTNPEVLMAELRKNPSLPSQTKEEQKAGLPAVVYDPSAGVLGASQYTAATSIASLAEGMDVEQQAAMRRRAENSAIVAKTRADMITRKTETIQTAVKALTPFYEEQSLVAIAQCEDALDVYGKLKSGLMSLGLYTGRDVELTTIREGEGAPAEEPIHILQALMFMDEESLINVHSGGADFANFQDFTKLLAEDDALLKRLIPFQRGIIGMRYTKDRKNYEGMDDYSAAMRNVQNEKCFLLVRNGARVTAVHSSIEKIERLFPTKKDLDRPFEGKFSWHGIESERITAADLNFSEARSDFDRMVLHYRRLVILLAGLYDRERAVIGDIPVLGELSGLALLKLPMQESAFRPVSDEEFALGSGRPGFWDWLQEKNAMTQSGSRVMCVWRNLMNSTTAPGAVRHIEGYGSSRSYDEVLYAPKEKSGLAVVYRDKEDLKVSVAVSGETRDFEKREFDAAVNISKYRRDYNAFGFLCLDDVTPEEITHYVYSRYDRRSYLAYVPLLLGAREVLEADRRHERPLRDALRAAAREAGMGAKDDQLDRDISTVIRQWRAAHRGAQTPSVGAVAENDWLGNREVRSMLDQLWILAGRGRDRKLVAEQIAADEKRSPLRLTISGTSKLYLYTTPTDEEREDLLGPNPWAWRLTLEERKTKVSVVDRRPVLMRSGDTRETVLAEWPEAAKWIDVEVPHKLERDEVSALRNLGNVASSTARMWLGKHTDEAFDAILDMARRDTEERSKGFVSHGDLYLPLAVVRRTVKQEKYVPDENAPDSIFGKRRKEIELRHSFFVVGVSIDTPDALYLSGTPEQRKKVVEWFRRQYRNPESNIDGLRTRKQRAALTFLPVDSVREVTKSIIVSGRGFRIDGKFQSWQADAIRALEAVRSHSYEKAEADFVLRFDGAAEELYTLLRQT